MPFYGGKWAFWYIILSKNWCIYISIIDLFRTRVMYWEKIYNTQLWTNIFLKVSLRYHHSNHQMGENHNQLYRHGVMHLYIFPRVPSVRPSVHLPYSLNRWRYDHEIPFLVPQLVQQETVSRLPWLISWQSLLATCQTSDEVASISLQGKVIIPEWIHHACRLINNVTLNYQLTDLFLIS